jgi:hypothetical protein
MRKLLLALLPVLLVPPPAVGVPADGAATEALLRDDLESGRIDRETWLLETFRYVFAPERVSGRYVPGERTPVRCFTPVVREYLEAREELPAATVAELDSYLEPQGSLGRATYFSPSGLFELTYSTSGTDGVPSADVDPANGVPDFVERCAEYMDESWTVEVDDLGFTAPVLPADGTYDVSFQQMGAYGYTAPSGFTTEIVLHRSFIGFPPNTDPDGDQLGAAKVTCAHEFKHASQFSNNGWSEGNWVELDATWAEDIVYPDTNDYWNYVNNNGGHVLGQPWTPLNAGGYGSYEDCLWEHYLSNTYGNGIIVEVGNRLAANPSLSMQRAYQLAMNAYSTEWDVEYPGFLEWAWFTGSRAEPPFGFPDAPSLKRMNLRTPSVSGYPYVTSDSVNQLAGHPRRFNPPAGSSGSARILFDGDDAHENFTVSVIVEAPDGSFTIARPALAAGNELDWVVPTPWTDVAYVGVVVTNSRRSGGSVSYDLTVEDDPGGSTGIGPLVLGSGRLELLPVAPNPVLTATRIRWQLPRATRATVRIHDVTGRTVRTLVDGELPAGAGGIEWDGLDSRGRKVPAGVYWSRIDTGAESAARKVTVLR